MATRKSPGIGKGSDSNVNPVYKAAQTVSKYAHNVGKEFKQFTAASSKTEELSSKGSTYPPNDMADKGQGREYFAAQANVARKKQDAAQGQLLGAILQGRRYDTKGKQIK